MLLTQADKPTEQRKKHHLNVADENNTHNNNDDDDDDDNNTNSPISTGGRLNVKGMYSSLCKPISELWGVTCHMDHTANALRFNPSQPCRYSIYLPRS